MAFSLKLNFKYPFAWSPALSSKGGIYLKKEGRISKAYRLQQEGLTIKEIAAKMKLKELLICEMVNW